MSEKEKSTIGLITYHAAYNFGSVLQTYATIRTLENLGYKVETIDYRTKSQTLWYNNKKSYNNPGIRTKINNYINHYSKKDINIRKEKYESFIEHYIHPISPRVENYKEVLKANFNHDILISGSDQVWNFQCGEFKNEEFDSILPYFLQFGNPKKRIAYASSFGNQTLRNIKKYRDLLLKYDFLSTREPIGKEYVCKATGKQVELVCDPTWLLNYTQWKSLPGVYNPDNKKPYILVYTLYLNPYWCKVWAKEILKLAHKMDADVFWISPLDYFKYKNISVLASAGPLDFLSYMANAKFVITNTFHGTIFSMNFEKPFYSLNVEPGSRQGQILKSCDLEDRIINNPRDLADAKDFECNFNYSSQEIKKLRESSIYFLKQALDN